MIIIQDDTGTVENANAYISLRFLKDYAMLRGEDLSKYDDLKLEESIINATDYIDVRFRFIGDKLAGKEQTTELPRFEKNALEIDRFIKNGCAEYSFELLKKGSLFIDFDAMASLIKSQSSAVGPLSESVTYDEKKISSATYPVFQKADSMIKKSYSIDKPTLSLWRI